MPWIEQGTKQVYVTEKTLEEIKRRGEAIMGKGFALHGTGTFSDRDRYALWLQTGQKIETKSQLRDYCVASGVRVMESGDDASKSLQEAQEGAGTDYSEEIADATAKGKIPFAS